MALGQTMYGGAGPSDHQPGGNGNGTASLAARTWWKANIKRCKTLIPGLPRRAKTARQGKGANLCAVGQEPPTGDEASLATVGQVPPTGKEASLATVGQKTPDRGQGREQSPPLFALFATARRAIPPRSRLLRRGEGQGGVVRQLSAEGIDNNLQI